MAVLALNDLLQLFFILKNMEKYHIQDYFQIKLFYIYFYFHFQISGAYECIGGVFIGTGVKHRLDLDDPTGRHSR